AALTLIGKLGAERETGPVLVTVLDQKRLADYQQMVAALRGAGIRAELYLGSKNHNIGQQLKYADRRNAPCAIVQGSDEKARGKVQIKDLILGAQVGGGSADREAFLQKQQGEAQVAVQESELVDAVRKVLARHNVPWR
ncbi:MAG TPA: His/Gly/Thr/Pro-type tRNA ligase C-terminal domain-containing protein, partial [Afipia sp.]